jgi:hypothetical protein
MGWRDFSAKLGDVFFGEDVFDGGYEFWDIWEISSTKLMLNESIEGMPILCFGYL